MIFGVDAPANFYTEGKKTSCCEIVVRVQTLDFVSISWSFACPGMEAHLVQSLAVVTS